MKRDMDRVRAILLQIESLKGPSLKDLIEDGTTNEDFEELVYNLNLLVEAGFVSGIEAHTMRSKNWGRLDLTWQGHEFLDDIRDSNIWRMTKEGAVAVGGASVKVLWEMAKGYIKSEAARPGIPIG